MEILDRYLQAVKKQLPLKRQDDIIAELRANLEAQLEDKESALGRPLTTGESEDWLRELGAPVQVAAKYQPQQYLIGPMLFPTFWYVLKLVWLWATVIYVIVNVVKIAGAPSGTALLDAVLQWPLALATSTAWVTLIFAAIEFAVRQYPEKWRQMGVPLPVGGDWQPSSLPLLEKDAEGGKKPKSRSAAIAEVIFGFVLLVWLLLVPYHPYLLLGPGALYLQGSPFQLAPVMVTVYWVLVALTGLKFVWIALQLGRGRWQQTQPPVHKWIEAMGLIPMGMLLATPQHLFVTLKNPALDQARYGSALEAINKSIYLCALLVVAIAAMELVWWLGKMGMGAWRRRVAA